VSGRARRLSLAGVIAAIPLLALAGRQAADGVHGSPEETSFWSFTVGTSFGDTAPDAGEVSTITLSDDSRPVALLWAGGLAAAGGALLVLGARGLRRSTPSG
jgi:hypothetical protein